MENFVSEVAQNAGVIAPQASLDLSFRPLNPGPIKITSTALPQGRPVVRPRFEDGGVGDLTVTRRVDLFRPGRATPVASRIDSPQGTQSVVEYNATPEDLRAPGNWSCRVTNLESDPVRFNCSAAYPGRTALKSLVIKLGSQMQPGFNQFLQDVVRKLGVRIHLESGKSLLVNYDGTSKEVGASFIDFAEDAKHELGLKTTRFELPNLGDFKIKDVNSQQVEISLQGGTPKFPGGYAQLVLRFEEAGKEVYGKHADAHLKNIVLTLRLGLAVAQERLALGNVEASFPVKVDPTGFLGNIADIFVDFDKKVRHQVEGQILSRVDRPLGDAAPGQPAPPTIRQLAGGFFAKGLQFFLGRSARVYRVTADSQSITIYYF